MRAAVLRGVGSPPEPADVPTPSPADGEVLVEVLATPLNPIDIAVGAGRFYGGHPELPYVPGNECVGRVEGTEELFWVYGSGLGVRRDGGLAELVAAPREALYPVPNRADPALAGAMGIAGLAGWLPVVWRARVREGETVLVLGATGTVGLVAVQAARLLGAGRVVAAGQSEAGLARAKEAGADETVRLGANDLVAAFREACGGEGPNVVVDPLWGEPLAAALEACATGARIVNIGHSAGPEATITSAAVRGKQLEILGFRIEPAGREVIAREYRRLVEHALAGDVRVDIERVPLEDAAEAWRRQSEGAGVKLVIVP